MNITTAAATEYFLETSANDGRTWKAIPGAVYRIRFHDGVLCQYAAGGAYEAAEDAISRLLADPELGQDLYRVASR